ncbi:MAG: molybdopterin molybdotransferase MoeA [Anaerolineae bacterium]|nr:molybdopterin molybdotransferase MoeA [Anaerolineae bacterium]
MSDLMNVDQAVEQVLQHFARLPPEPVGLPDALNRIAAADIIAPGNIPPFANSSMDGFAVRAAATHGADNVPITLQVVMDIPAGSMPQGRLGAGEAARIMTGAPMPDGADAVVPVENTDARWNAGSNASLPAAVQVRRSVKAGDYVRPAGEDIPAGAHVIPAGRIIRAAEIGILASLGMETVSVIRQPRVAILSTGDELVDVGEALTPGKIRDSNGYVLAALAETYGAIPLRIPIARDTLEDVRRRFREALDSKPDLIISSAGVSVGAFDVVRAVMDELGKIDFWRINLRPGKPLAFGHLGGVPFFGLPGNPVSAMVTFDIFVRPALLRLRGGDERVPYVQAIVGEDLHSDGRRTYLRVTLRHEHGVWVATTTGNQSSGALTSMMLADGLLIVPEDMGSIPAGTALPVRLLRDQSEYV